MKNLITLLVLTFSIVININATVWRVNSSLNSDANFSEVQPAIDAAAAGDIIHIESGSYSGFTVNKQLSLQGTCYERAPHAAIATPPAPVFINGDVTFAPGASGSSISSVNLATSNSEFRIKTNDILITRCKIHTFFFISRYSDGETSITKTTINNIVVSNTVITSSIQSSTNSYDTLIVTNVLFNNSYIGQISLPTVSSSSYLRSFSCSFSQCIINSSIFIYNSNFQNSIFENGLDALSNVYSNNVTNCLFKSAQPTSSNYILGTNNIFGATDIYDTSSAYWKLSTTTAAIGAGIGGYDIGIYGGNNPFIPGGYLQQPTITKLLMPVQVSGNVNIEVEAKVIE